MKNIFKFFEKYKVEPKEKQTKRINVRALTGKYYGNIGDGAGGGLANNYADLLREPDTIAKYRLDNGARDYGSKKANKQYKNHRIKVNNQWVNALQSINTGNGTAQYSFYNFQAVDYLECSILAQDSLMNNVFSILVNTSLAKGGELKVKNKGEEEIEGIYRIANKYKVNELLAKAVRSSFVYGGCLVFLDFGDETDNSKPLDYDKINFRDFKGFRHIDPINCSAVNVETA
ncbi:MAG: DUF1073 domain-containing protein, partial [Rickettsiales bacterium]|nr:DUF1073 domain-containing protein [Rickettsiales bacterium]